MVSYTIPRGLVIAIVWLLLLAFPLSGCDTTIGVELVNDDNRQPAFRITGNEDVSLIWVFGPYPPDPIAEKPPIIWQINSINSNPLPNEIPIIVYGKVPAGWQQEVPKGTTTPELTDGALYAISVLTTRNRTAGLLFQIQNGKPVEYKGKLWWKDKSTSQ